MYIYIYTYMYIYIYIYVYIYRYIYVYVYVYVYVYIYIYVYTYIDVQLGHLPTPAILEGGHQSVDTKIHPHFFCFDNGSYASFSRSPSVSTSGFSLGMYE